MSPSGDQQQKQPVNAWGKANDTWKQQQAGGAAPAAPASGATAPTASSAPAPQQPAASGMSGVTGSASSAASNMQSAVPQRSYYGEQKQEGNHSPQSSMSPATGSAFGAASNMQSHAMTPQSDASWAPATFPGSADGNQAASGQQTWAPATFPGSSASGGNYLSDPPADPPGPPMAGVSAENNAASSAANTQQQQFGQQPQKWQRPHSPGMQQRQPHQMGYQPQRRSYYGQATQ